MVAEAVSKGITKLFVLAVVLGAGGMALIFGVGYLIAWAIGLI